MDAQQRILAQAYVDLLEEADPGFPSVWEVQVQGVSPYTLRRTYTLTATTDNNAAQEGLRLFVEEMENLRDAFLKGY